MAGKVIQAKSATISGATAAGVVTIGSTVGWYAGAYGNINNSGATVRSRCYITEVISSTTLGIRLIPDNPFTEVNGIMVGAPNYGRSDVTVYNGGTLYQDDQFVYNVNDAPLA